MGLLLAKAGRSGSSDQDWFSFWGSHHLVLNNAMHWWASVKTTNPEPSGRCLFLDRRDLRVVDVVLGQSLKALVPPALIG